MSRIVHDCGCVSLFNDRYGTMKRIKRCRKHRHTDHAIGFNDAPLSSKWSSAENPPAGNLNMVDCDEPPCEGD